MRWWDIATALTSGFFTLLALLVLGFLGWWVLFDPRPGLLAPVQLLPGVVVLLSAAAFVGVFILLLVPAQRVVERQLAKERPSQSSSGLDDPDEQDGLYTRSRRAIAERFFLDSGRAPHALGVAVQRYHTLHCEAGLASSRASLLIEEGRSIRWSGDEGPTLESLVDRALVEVTLGEVEPVTLPVRFLSKGLVLPAWIVFFVFGPFAGFRVIGGVPILGTYGLMMLGMSAPFLVIVGYACIREMGFLPFGLWRAECSCERTRVFHGLRWKTFRPGRDLAVVRLTGKREADIALLGADGDHAMLRAGGRSLDHFLACWALAPASAYEASDRAIEALAAARRLENSTHTLLLVQSTGLWREQRWARWWDVRVASAGVMLAVVVTMLAAVLLLFSPLIPEIKPLEPIPEPFGLAPVVAGLLMLGVFALCFSPVAVMLERELDRFRVPLRGFGEEGSLLGGGAVASAGARRAIVGEVFCAPPDPEVDPKTYPGSPAALVQRYDALHEEAGLSADRASLLVQEGRSAWWDRTPGRSPRLGQLVASALAEGPVGGAAPMALPVVLRLPGLLLPAGIALVLLSRFPAELMTRLSMDAAVSLAPRIELIELFATGMVFVGVAVVGVAGLRELGLVPVGRWRGRCTQHETVVSRRFRWQTFRPGRDLAVVRVTGTREADILLLGVGGGWWSGRIGGRELDHFLRCWSSVVRGAGQEGDR